MSELIPDTFALDKGLDLNSPKLMAPKGSLLDCLNYENVDFIGLKRIDGFDRFDGRVSPVIYKWDTIEYTLTSGSIALGDSLYFSENATTPYVSLKLLGIIMDLRNVGGTLFLDIAYANDSYIPPAGSILQNSTGANTVTVVAVSDGTGTDPATYFSTLIGYQQDLRDRITAPPDLVIGAHHINNNCVSIVKTGRIEYAVSLGGTITFVDRGSGNLTNAFNGATGSAFGVDDNFIYFRDLGTGDWSAVPNGTSLGGFITDTGVVSQTLSVDYNRSSHIYYTTDEASWDFISGGLSGYSTWNSSQASFTIRVTNVTIEPETVARRAFTQGTKPPSGSIRYRFTTTGQSIVPLDYFLVSGSFAAGDAEILLQYVIITTFPSTFVQMPKSGDVLQRSTNSGGSYTTIGTTSNNASYNALPGLHDLVDANSRYVAITSNFYGADTAQASYWASGASPAFAVYSSSFSSETQPESTAEYYSFIYTENTAPLVIRPFPRHVANHHTHLSLGYHNARLDISVAGQPTNFSGLDGATSFALGDEISGLLPLNGTTLGVFCEQSIWAVTGTTVDNFASQIISPSVGALEYTVCDFGSPVYANNYGIYFLEQTAAYGDFLGVPMSQNISTWLRPRLRGTSGSTSSTRGALVAIPVRNKNQYRLIFKSGEILTMTLNGRGKEPTFTFQQYYLETSNVFYPLAVTSQVDNFGRERIIMSHFSPISNYETNFLYEFDRGGFGFDGNYIPYLAETNWIFGEGASVFTGVQKVRIHGLSYGKAHIKVSSSGIQNEYESEYNATQIDINLPRTDGFITEDLEPTTNIANLANRGLGLQFKFENGGQALEPPHVIQVLTLHAKHGGAADK